MLNLGEHTIESYAHILNVDKSILKLNSTLEKFGYRFLWIDASEFEKNFSEIVNVPKNTDRRRTVIMGGNQQGISHELHNALMHTPTFGLRFMVMECPGIMLLQKLHDFKILGDKDDFMIESKELHSFYSFLNDLLIQLRLYKVGEIRCSQLIHITSISRQISWRRMEISIGSTGDFKISNEDAKNLSQALTAKYECNSLTELAVRNFNITYNIPDGQIRFITLMTCLESLFNLGKDQIAHTIARHLSIILSSNQEEFKNNYKKIKGLYNKRNLIVHGGAYKGNIIEDYLELSDKVRAAIKYCNNSNLTKEKLFEELNSKGF